jgi:glycosyltransferase involved in cell wall biosynthesis
MSANPTKLLFLVTEDWYFWTHRLDLARAARNSGFDVGVATRVQDYGSRLRAEGFQVYPLGLSRRSRQPFREAAAIAELVGLYEKERPRIVHHVAMKPILYGTIAARLSRVPVVVNAFAGLGYGFSENDEGSAALRYALKNLLRLVLSSSGAIALFQNSEDCDALVKLGVVNSRRTRIIRGAGVNVREFSYSPEPEGNPVVLLASRMLWTKGAGEFVEAARILKGRGCPARFVLVGEPDADNPGNIPRSQLREWAESGAVEWWGRREDMPQVLAQSSIVVLPTYYREGLPKVLLEAGACGRPAIATNIPGCRDVIRHGTNGLLIPPRSVDGLVEAIQRLLERRQLREELGRNARTVVEQEYSSTRIADQTLELYSRLLSGHAVD